MCRCGVIFLGATFKNSKTNPSLSHHWTELHYAESWSRAVLSPQTLAVCAAYLSLSSTFLGMASSYSPIMGCHGHHHHWKCIGTAAAAPYFRLENKCKKYDYQETTHTKKTTNQNKNITKTQQKQHKKTRLRRNLKLKLSPMVIIIIENASELLLLPPFQT